MISILQEYYVVILGLTGIFLYYCFVVASKPIIHTGNKNLKTFLQKNVPIVNKKYWPSFFFWEGRLQTIFGLQRRMPISKRLPYEREILKMKDGGKISLDFLHPDAKDSTKNENSLAIILPGLASSSQTAYVKTIALAITKYAHTPVVVFNYRGVGGVPLETSKTYCATQTDDLQEVLDHLKTKYPTRNLIGVGTSLGGIILGRYLIDYPKESKEIFMAAVIVSAVWDIWGSKISMESSINMRLFNRPLAKSIVQLAMKYRKQSNWVNEESVVDYHKILGCKTIQEFDRNYTVPQFGYKCVKDYYDHGSIGKEVDKFSVPVFALNALDDPMSPGESCPIEVAQKSQNVAFVITKRGGHLGFLEGWLPRMKESHFMEKFVVQVVRGVNDYFYEI